MNDDINTNTEINPVAKNDYITITIPASHVVATHGPAFVFAWFRAEKCLFVGTAGRGGIDQATILGMSKSIDDNVVVWLCKKSEMVLLEILKRKELQPVLNMFGGDGANGTCQNCHNPFQKRRKWQEYCSEECRNQALFKRKKLIHALKSEDSVAKTQREIMDMLQGVPISDLIAEQQGQKKKDKNGPATVLVKCPECQTEHEITKEELKDLNNRFCRQHKHLRFAGTGLNPNEPKLSQNEASQNKAGIVPE